MTSAASEKRRADAADAAAAHKAAECARLSDALEAEKAGRAADAAALGADILALETKLAGAEASHKAAVEAAAAEREHLQAALARARRDAAELHAQALAHVEEMIASVDSARAAEVARLEKEAAAREQREAVARREHMAAAEARHKAELDAVAQRRARLLAWAQRAAQGNGVISAAATPA
jgi:hypothetical protein